MYKFGIWRPADLDNTRTLFGKTRQYSYVLLRIPAQPTRPDIGRFEKVIRTVRLSSGVCRTTYPSRFDDLDLVVQGLLQRVFSRSRTLDFHDVAASDGLLTTRWGDRVQDTFPHARMTASDSILFLMEAVWRSGDTYVLEPDGRPIQYINPPFVVSIDTPERVVYPLNVLVRAWGRRRLPDLCAHSAEVGWDGVCDERVISRGGWTFRQIPLIHPTALSYARRGRLRIICADAFSYSLVQYDVIRVMNLYQPMVFAPEQVQESLRFVVDSLADGGVLIAGRTMEREGGRNDVSIFRKAAGRLRILERVGRGFEFEPFLGALTS